MLKVSSIQRLCVHDGPGVRTTIFLRGCSLNCPWCCNGETKSTAPEFYLDKSPTYTTISTQQLYDKIIEDRAYYGKDGGVTFSGGEPLLQADNMLKLLQMIKAEGISTYIETSLYVPHQNIIKADQYIDGYIVDLKILDNPFLYDKNCDFELNFHYLWKKITTLRMVLIDGLTDTEQNIDKLELLLNTYPIKSIEFLQYHSLGVGKAAKAGIAQQVFTPSSAARIEQIIGQIKGSRYEKV